MRRLLYAAALLAASAPALSAQTTIYSTFGPGNTYNTGIGYLVGGGGRPNASWVESSFLFGGTTGTQLGGVEFAAFGGVGPLTVQFLTGDTPSASSVLESWSVPNPGDGIPKIFSLVSSTNAGLTNGSTYWLRLEAAAESSWGWDFAIPPYVNLPYVSTDLGMTWQQYKSDAAFAVTSLDSSSVTPEPATMTLMATGLVGLAGFTRRRKRV